MDEDEDQEQYEHDEFYEEDNRITKQVKDDRHPERQ